MKRLRIGLGLAAALCGCQHSPAVPTVDAGATPAVVASAKPPAKRRVPSEEGAVRQLLAVDDDRAVAVFVPLTEAGVPTPTLALMHADGSVDWSLPLGVEPSGGRSSSGIEIVGDAVSVGLPRADGALDRIAIYGLSDGQLRAAVSGGKEHYQRETSIDEDMRFDLVRDIAVGRGVVIATGAHGERWRTPVGKRAASELVAVGDVLAVHLGQPSMRAKNAPAPAWQLMSRTDGRIVAKVEGDEGSCTDGKRWFITHEQSVLEVSLRDYTTRVVINVPRLPGNNEEVWMRDCVVVGGQPAAFVQRGMTEALVTVDPATGVLQHVSSLGIRRRRSGWVHPLPGAMPSVAVTLSTNNLFNELGIADIREASTTLGAGPSVRHGARALLPLGTTHYVVATRRLIATIDGDTGVIVGRHLRRDTTSVHRSQLKGTKMWLPPASPFRLGQATPTVVDLLGWGTRVKLHTASELQAPRTVQCTDEELSSADGIGTFKGHGAVTQSRKPPWDPARMASAARDYACAPDTAKVVILAWSVIEDERPLRNHNLLVLVEHGTAEAPIYTAVAMYRHATNKQWNVARSFHSSGWPIHRYAQRPTTADLDAFVDQSGSFDFEPRRFKVLAGNVLDDHWLAATGERPSRHFLRAVEQAD